MNGLPWFIFVHDSVHTVIIESRFWGEAQKARKIVSASFCPILQYDWHGTSYSAPHLS